jgi:hypothetical protein
MVLGLIPDLQYRNRKVFGGTELHCYFDNWLFLHVFMCDVRHLQYRLVILPLLFFQRTIPKGHQIATMRRFTAEF